MQGRRPSILCFRRIDETARNGEFWIVRDAQSFAVARWALHWQFANGRPLFFEPDEYHPGQR